MNYGNQRHKGKNQDEKTLHGASLEIELFEIAQLHATCAALLSCVTLPTGTNIFTGRPGNSARTNLAGVHARVKIYSFICKTLGSLWSPRRDADQNRIEPAINQRL
jgi:hypothetical protein